jgi:chemotaxis protein CheC
MMSFSNQLTPMQIDCLKELTNIGGGNAATALSLLVNRKIKMEVPKVSLVPYEQLFSHIIGEEEEVAAVSIRVFGDTPGNFLFIIKAADAVAFINMLTGVEDLTCQDEIAVSAIQEACNILCSSYINAMSRLLDITLISSVPAFVQDMFGAILTTAYIESGQIDDSLLLIENMFLTENISIKAHLFYIPIPGSLDRIFSIMNI